MATINSSPTMAEKAHDDVTHKEKVETYDSESQSSTGEEPMTFRKAMALVAMAFLWTGSQIPLYLYGGAPPYM